MHIKAARAACIGEETRATTLRAGAKYAHVHAKHKHACSYLDQAIVASSDNVLATRGVLVVRRGDEGAMARDGVDTFSCAYVPHLCDVFATHAHLDRALCAFE